jgi:uncharacterized protein YpmS
LKYKYIESVDVEKMEYIITIDLQKMKADNEINIRRKHILEESDRIIAVTQYTRL